MSHPFGWYGIYTICFNYRNRFSCYRPILIDITPSGFKGCETTVLDETLSFKYSNKIVPYLFWNIPMFIDERNKKSEKPSLVFVHDH